jgi:hypothetical protein
MLLGKPESGRGWIGERDIGWPRLGWVESSGVSSLRQGSDGRHGPRTKKICWMSVDL